MEDSAGWVASMPREVVDALIGHIEVMYADTPTSELFDALNRRISLMSTVAPSIEWIKE